MTDISASEREALRAAIRRGAGDEALRGIGQIPVARDEEADEMFDIDADSDCAGEVCFT